MCRNGCGTRLSSLLSTTGQPVKIVFRNADATDHNLLFVRPGAVAEVGMAANEMAKDPKNANSDFHPPNKQQLILHASPDDRSYPQEPGPCAAV